MLMDENNGHSRRRGRLKNLYVTAVVSQSTEKPFT